MATFKILQLSREATKNKVVEGEIKVEDVRYSKVSKKSNLAPLTRTPVKEMWSFSPPRMVKVPSRDEENLKEGEKS